jgi:hypothetical protein
MALVPLPRADTRAFFRPLMTEMIALWRVLPADAWERPTAAGAWQVRDVAAHLLDITLRRLSFHRDAHVPPSPAQPPRSDREFVAFINELNREWVHAARRLSPRLLTDVYQWAAAELADFVEAFPADGAALFPVSWAGEDASEGWFDIGREFTEQWHHQMQIRDAVGAPPFRNEEWLHAVLLIALRGVPPAYRHVEAPDGSAVTLHLDGVDGGDWTLQRDQGSWRMWQGRARVAGASITTSADTAWRLLFNGLSPEDVEARSATTGDPELYRPFFRARSVIV